MQWEIIRGNLGTGTAQAIAYDDATFGDPKAVVGVVTTATDLTEIVEDAGICKFFWDMSTQVSTFAWHEQATNGDTRRGTQGTAFYLDKNGGTNFMDGSIAVDTVDGEFDLSFTNAPASTYEYAFLVFYGSDVSADAGWVDGDDQTITTSFLPSFVLTGGASTGAAVDASSSNMAYNSGCAGSDATTPTQGCIRYGSRDNFSSAYAQFSDSNVLLNMFAAAPTESVTIDGVTSTTFDWSLPTGTNEPGIYLAIKCDNAVDVSIRSASAATGTLPYTGVGFEPGLLVVGGAIMDAVDTTYNDAKGANLLEGMADLTPAGGTVYASWRMSYEDTVESRLQVSHSNLLYGKDWVASAGTADEFAATVSATGPDGFTINRSTADDIVQFWVLAIEAEAAGTTHTIDLDDSVAVSDAIDVEQGHARGLEDTAAPSDSITVEQAHAVSLEDTVAPTDAITVSHGFVLELSESVAPADSITYAATYARALEDTTAPVDSLAVEQAHAVSLEDTVAPTDAITVETGSEGVNHTIDLEDTVATSDALAFSVEYSRTFIDAVTPTDSLSEVLGEFVGEFTIVTSRNDETDVVVGELVTPTESFAIELGKAFSESVAPADSIAYSATYSRDLAESVEPTEGAVFSIGHILEFSESVTAFDTITVSSSASSGVALQDSVVPTDSLAYVANYVRTFDESVAVAESMEYSAEYHIELSESVGLLEDSIIFFEADLQQPAILEGDPSTISINGKAGD